MTIQRIVKDDIISPGRAMEYAEVLARAIRIMAHHAPLTNADKIAHYAQVIIWLATAPAFVAENYERVNDAISEAEKVINQEG